MSKLSQLPTLEKYLSLNFAAGQRHSPSMVFVRESQATGQLLGVKKTFANNVPRMDRGILLPGAEGLLVEGQTANIISGDLNIDANTTVSRVNNAPDLFGTNTCIKSVVPSSLSAPHSGMYWYSTNTITPEQMVSASFYVRMDRKNTRLNTAMYYYTASGSYTPMASANWSPEAPVSNNSVKVIDVGDGWFRVQIIAKVPANARVPTQCFFGAWVQKNTQGDVTVELACPSITSAHSAASSYTPGTRAGEVNVWDLKDIFSTDQDLIGVVKYTGIASTPIAFSNSLTNWERNVTIDLKVEGAAIYNNGNALTNRAAYRQDPYSTNTMAFCMSKSAQRCLLVTDLETTGPVSNGVSTNYADIRYMRLGLVSATSICAAVFDNIQLWRGRINLEQLKSIRSLYA